jgi:hypothetical protein
MRLLALNPRIPLSARYQLALGALPIGGVFASFLPLVAFALWLESALGIPPNTPVAQHSNGMLFFALYLGAMVLLMVLGYAAGWVANAAIARLVLRWPSAKIAAVFLRSDVPAHWLKHESLSDLDTAEDRLENSRRSTDESTRPGEGSKFI